LKKAVSFFKNIFNSLGFNKDRIVTEEELRQFLETYLQTYRLAVDLGIPPEYKKYIELYNVNPTKVKATISTLSGVSIEFSTAQKKTILINKTEDRIENSLFKQKKPLTSHLKKIQKQYPRFKNKKNNKKPFFVGPKYTHWENFVFNTGKGTLLDLSKKDSNITFKNIYVDNIHYPNLIEVYENNRFKFWTLKQAIKRGGTKFYTDIKSAYTKSHEFRKLGASPILHPLANKIAQKEQKGKYGGIFGAISYENDLKVLYEKSSELKIDNEFTRIILENQRKKAGLPSWSSRNSLFVGIFSGLVTYGITENVDFKSLWNWLMSFLS
tara:strand:- start:71 stop:1045 length:975 start_codon:yes stop_codon:yes gene_type:complete